MVAGAETQTDKGISQVVNKLLTTTDPLCMLAALAILVGLPTFIMKLPEVIRAVSTFVDTYRKTSNKIRMDRAKLERAMAGRSTDLETKKKGRKR
jgi:hypothetical protein